MSKLMLIDAAHPEETRVAIVNNGQVDDFDFETTGNEQLRGNIYLAKITRVEPSLQAAFVEYGGNRHGFLAFSEIHPDYYQLPQEDREALLREAAEAAAAAEEDDDAVDLDEDSEDDDHDDDEHDDIENDAESDADDTDASDEDDSGEDDETEASADDDDTVSDETDDEKAKPKKKPRAKAEARKPRRKSKRPNLSRRYKIQEVIRRRQVMLVQVVKEERGNKGAALTTYLSLAGRYSVLMPNTPRGGGISRKIASGTDRKRLKKIVADLDVPEGQGLIVRTAGGKRTKTEIKRDYDYLSKLWETIVEKTLSSEAPMLINEEGSLVHRAMRDMFDKDIEEVLVQGETAYREAKDLAKLIMPSQAKKVQHWKDDDPLFVAEGTQEQLDSIYSPTVTLKSGGYLVINQTEALVAIDVNSGKSTKERNIEQTAVRTNLEAAEEACRQMRLRDLAGLVVIDFIDMDENKNNRSVEKRLKDCLKVDRARVQHGRISQFGLMEISRQRRRQGVLQATSDPCSVCNGTGRRRSIASAALQLIRAIEARASTGGLKSITVKAPTDVALYLLNNKREELLEIENSAGFAVAIHSSDDLLPGDFTIDAERDPKQKPKKRRKPRSLSKPSKQVDPDLDEEEDDEASARSDDEDGDKPKKRRRRRGGRGRNKRDADGDALKTDASDTDDEDSGETSGDADASDNDDDEKPKKRRRRGRRGGRRRRKGNGDDAPEDGGAYLDGLAASAPEMLDEAKPDAETKDAEPDAQPDTSADDTPAEDKPKRRRRRSPAKAAATETADAAETAPAEPVADADAKEDAPAEKPKRRSRAKPKPAEPAEVVEAAAAPEPKPEPAAETKDSGPAKKGWWARARGK
jgi:ribonuclease E